MIKNYMKKVIAVMVLLMVAFCADAQIHNPVFWSYTAKKTADKTYELHITASVNASWRLYGQGSGIEFEPTTSFAFIKNPLVSFDGYVKEIGKPEKYYDKNVKAELKYYTQKVDFVQKIKVRSLISTVVKGTVKYVVCNDRSCLPPKDLPFTIDIGGK